MKDTSNTIILFSWCSYGRRARPVGLAAFMQLAHVFRNSFTLKSQYKIEKKVPNVANEDKKYTAVFRVKS